MTDKTFEAGVDKGADLAAQQLESQEIERAKAARAEADRALGLDPARVAYLAEHHSEGDLSIEDWDAMVDHLAEQETSA
jgi:hypothetical protein